jgi:hypothetical protein
MDSNTKELLYQELMLISTLLDEGAMNAAKYELENLINKIQYNQL